MPLLELPLRFYLSNNLAQFDVVEFYIVAEISSKNSSKITVPPAIYVLMLDLAGLRVFVIYLYLACNVMQLQSNESHKIAG